jgi:HEPN domain-containing protein
MDRAKQLVNKAEIDLIAAKNLLQHNDSYPESIAFHLQQAMEKSLKAMLAFCNSEIPRT